MPRERHGSIPRFGDFAVAEQDVGIVIQMVERAASAMPAPTLKALAKRTGRHVTNGKPRCWMALEVAVELAEFQQFARWK